MRTPDIPPSTCTRFLRHLSRGRLGVARLLPCLIVLLSPFAAGHSIAFNEAIDPASAAQHVVTAVRASGVSAGNVWRAEEEAIARVRPESKSVADGLIMEGNVAYQASGGSVSITLDFIRNNSTTRTTGTLRLELWATTSKPGRGQGFSGYKLATSQTLSGLAPRSFYSNSCAPAASRRRRMAPTGSSSYWPSSIPPTARSLTASASATAP